MNANTLAIWAQSKDELVRSASFYFADWEETASMRAFDTLTDYLAASLPLYYGPHDPEARANIDWHALACAALSRAYADL